MDKYYYVKYRWRNLKGRITSWQHSVAVSDYSPMEFIHNNINNDYYTDEYIVDFYSEITKEEFDKLQDIIGYL